MAVAAWARQAVEFVQDYQQRDSAADGLASKRRRESAGPQACLLLSGQNGLS